MQDCKDGRGLQFIEFRDRWSRTFASRYFDSVNISLLPLLLTIFSSYFNITRQAPDHNQRKNALYEGTFSCQQH